MYWRDYGVGYMIQRKKEMEKKVQEEFAKARKEVDN